MNDIIAKYVVPHSWMTSLLNMLSHIHEWHPCWICCSTYNAFTLIIEILVKSQIYTLILTRINLNIQSIHIILYCISRYQILKNETFNWFVTLLLFRWYSSRNVFIKLIFISVIYPNMSHWFYNACMGKQFVIVHR